MYAVIKAQGHQYKVRINDQIMVDSLSGKEGEKIIFDQVLLLVDKEEVFLGQPTVAQAQVVCQIIKHLKGDKLRVARFRAKSRYHKVTGFRPYLTKLKVIDIKIGKKTPKKGLTPK